jgi:hypothetical protein
MKTAFIVVFPSQARAGCVQGKWNVTRDVPSAETHEDGSAADRIDPIDTACGRRVVFI